MYRNPACFSVWEGPLSRNWEVRIGRPNSQPEATVRPSSQQPGLWATDFFLAWGWGGGAGAGGDECRGVPKFPLKGVRQKGFGAVSVSWPQKNIVLWVAILWIWKDCETPGVK